MMKRFEVWKCTFLPCENLGYGKTCHILKVEERKLNFLLLFNCNTLLILCWIQH